LLEYNDSIHKSKEGEEVRSNFNRLLKNGHLLRFPHPSSLRRTAKYASLLRISGAPAKRDFAKLNLHLPACRSLGAGRALFEQPGKDDFFSSLLTRGELQ
jgi:hypothetical protein